MADPTTRLYLMTPPLADAGDVADALTAALDAGDVACLLVALAARDEGSAKKIVRALVQICEPRGVALLIDTVGLVARAGADGAHLRLSGDSLERTLAEAVERLKPDRILGAGGLRAKHDAMIAGEHDVDYVCFGDPSPDGFVPPLELIVDRISWWSEIFNVPCVAYARSLDEIAPLTVAGADFIALREAVWDDPRGPAAAVVEALALIESAGASVA